jgi:hypothetical protein
MMKSRMHNLLTTTNTEGAHISSAQNLTYWRNWLARAWPDAEPPTRQDGFVVDTLLIILAWALVSFPFLSGHSFIAWDDVDAFFPQARFVASAISHGHAPWWNPYVFGGQPVLGDPQGMIFTPQVLIGILTGAHFNLYLFDLTSLAMELCGGIALARYARTYSNTRTLPILGALVFIAGGVATSRLEHATQIDSYSLLPLQLLALRAVCLRPTVLRTVLLTLALTAGVLNLNQVVFLSFFAFLPFMGLHLYESSYRPRAFLALAVAGIVVVLADMPVLSAIKEFLAFSNRATMGVGASVGYSFPAFNLASIFLPGMYGVLSPQNGLWPPTDPSQDYLYIGIIPVSICLSSLLFLFRMSAITALCWISIVLWFTFAMGTNTPFYPALFHHVPGFSNFRRPADGAFFLNLFMALLIGSFRKPERPQFDPWPLSAAIATLLMIGLGCVLTLLWPYAQRSGHVQDCMIILRAFAWRVAIIGAVGLAFVSIRWRTKNYLLAPIMIAVTIGDLSYPGRAGAVFAPGWNAIELPDVYSGSLSWNVPRNPLEQTITFLQSNGVAGANPVYRMEAIGGSLGGSMPMAFRILTTQGYNPLVSGVYREAVGAQYLQNETKHFTAEAPSYNSSDYRRLSLRYVLIQRDIAAHAAQFGPLGAAAEKIRANFIASNWAQRLPDQGEYEIWQLSNALPRAMLLTANGSERTCDLTSYGTVLVSVQCHSTVPGLLILGDAFAPGWRACVNDNPARVEPYDSIFRSVAVPEGDSWVTFRYQPIPFLRNSYCSKH